MSEKAQLDITDPSDQRQALELASNYAKTLLQRFPEYSEWLWDQKSIRRSFSLLDVHRDFQKEIGEAPSLAEVARAMRRVKQRHFLRLALRDLIGLDDLQSSTGQLSDFACAAFQTAYQFLEKFPHLWNGVLLIDEIKSGNLSLAVIGLGKLGAHELNFVSDVDIMFIYEMDPTSSNRLLHEVVSTLTRLCHALVHLVDDIVEGDRLFKVDLRLRPGGKDSELVVPLPFALHHYLVEGQSWERFALIKASPLAGNISLGNYLIREVQPFIYRRFLDFQALDEIRRMRDRILSETPPTKPGPGYDVKLGIGGIREIEFIVQALQIIYGGRKPDLREASTLKALKKLAKEEILPEDVAMKLSEAYEFLRRTEHWIQLANNVQSHKIPRSATAMEKLVRAVMRVHPSEEVGPYIEQFIKHLHNQTDFVNNQFRSLFGEEFTRYGGRGEEVPKEEEETEALNSRCIKEIIEKWSASKELSEEKKAFVAVVADRSSTLVCKLPNSFPAETAAVKIIRFMEGVLRRPGLVKFFLGGSRRHQSNRTLQRALEALIRSPFAANILIHLPGLAENLKDTFQDFEDWSSECSAVMESTPAFEEKIQWLRRFKNERLLTIVLQDILKNPGPEIIGTELTRLAEYFVNQTYRITCERLGINPEAYPLCVCALGKLGSREMGYHSDLDLMFVFSAELADNGKGLEQIPEETVKLVQRFVRLLSINLEEGPGYEVDMRLRPSGNYGPLVVTRRAWDEYYQDQADPWEYASLVRFRPVAGNGELARVLVDRVTEILSVPRDPEKVWRRLCDLRKRMEEERLGETGDREGIHIKLGSGGLADIELWCQGTVVVWNRPGWTPGTTTGELLPGVLDTWNVNPREAEKIADAFRILRWLELRTSLVHPEGHTGWLKPDDWEALESYGLLPLKEAELSYGDVKRAMSLIRLWWNRVCDTRRPF
ncbi:bifunctional [glutamate--ammonia ligase]-adenylyl-L-tyrosine phosphorylase/[glutamate--ammonia-ligase] adenylyltransferase [Thermodesulforhabdus norvegica]|uniref:Glutamate-ammonia-ligase adenylyltransferase n=1 Tax=Thermodesulforhabdus norvegica TaxID=39841 RepID=A0A1I4RBE9_9BACT|nr:bifunctional [glutamate--ammonia ligase]-adenylyl-L-tyrosine phosphorylase/[glutamate--ammonia-ligase] adenylyltransferase [Thermodesulforhabdus norvegica]SFM49203.1 glutamate-ammonia-ligase adenylyltransferase [Thermodesulforhabdus norvegica]